MIRFWFCKRLQLMLDIRLIGQPGLKLKVKTLSTHWTMQQNLISNKKLSLVKDLGQPKFQRSFAHQFWFSATAVDFLPLLSTNLYFRYVCTYFCVHALVLMGELVLSPTFHTGSFDQNYFHPTHTEGSCLMWLLGPGKNRISQNSH